MSTKSRINIDVELDENKVPEKIHWQTSDKDVNEETKAFFLSVWNEEQGTMKIDLWTKEMKVDEMKFMVHQSILSMADTFERATGEHAMALTMKDFCEYFAEKMNLVK